MAGASSRSPPMRAERPRGPLALAAWLGLAWICAPAAALAGDDGSAGALVRLALANLRAPELAVRVAAETHGGPSIERSGFVVLHREQAGLRQTLVAGLEGATLRGVRILQIEGPGGLRECHLHAPGEAAPWRVS